MYICKTRKIKEYQSVKNCLVGHFSVKNLPRNLLKEAGPPPQMRSGPGYFSCTLLVSVYTTLSFSKYDWHVFPKSLF